MYKLIRTALIGAIATVAAASAAGTAAAVPPPPPPPPPPPASVTGTTDPATPTAPTESTTATTPAVTSTGPAVPPPPTDAEAPSVQPASTHARLLRTDLVGRVLHVRLTCAGKGSIALRLAHTRSPLASAALGCGNGTTSVALKLQRSGVRRLHKRSNVATLVVSTESSTDELPFRVGGVPSAHKASLTSVNTYCTSPSGYGGSENIAIEEDETFGMAAPGESVWWFSYLYVYGSGWIPANGWQIYTVSPSGTPASSGSTTTVGGSGGGDLATSNSVWDVGPGLWTYAGFYVYTARAGYQWVWAPSSPDNVILVRYWEGWCGFP